MGGDAATVVTNSTGLQTVDYTYNVRGWLKQINDPASLGNDLFAFKIGYNEGTNALYNGNISVTQWKTANTDNSLKSYDYTYDALNRITSGIDNTGNYNLANISYDKNGNITNLQRQGHTNEAATSFGVMDNLTYTYQNKSNKLVIVSDAGNNTYGFKDDYTGSGTDTSNDYTYDANGNMETDTNKGITSITYNHLNLPTQVHIGTGNISYIYDATGVKLKKIVSAGTTTEYAGNYVYEDTGAGSSLKFFNHPEGYVSPELVSGSVEYDHVYQYKDHLGNVRLSYTDSDNNGSVNSSEILEENNYYPFGLRHKGYNSNINGVDHPYGFGGKEEQNELGLNSYDFGVRNYNPELGRWFNIDPFAEFMRNQSPYNFGFNNPIYFSDFGGNIPWPVPEVWMNWVIGHISHWHSSNRPLHQGLDVNFSGGGNTDLGAPIVATHSGKVVFVKTTTTGGNGREIRIESPDGSFMTRYLHLSSISVSEEQEISEGQTIGLMGGSGGGIELKYPVHLHYEIHKRNSKNQFVIGKRQKGNTSINPWNGNQPIDPQLWIKPHRNDYYDDFEYQSALYAYEYAEEDRKKETNRSTQSESESSSTVSREAVSPVSTISTGGVVIIQTPGPIPVTIPQINPGGSGGINNNPQPIIKPPKRLD